MLSHRNHLLVLDAKHRGIYASDTGIESPSPDDIDKMHAYREAICNVWGAFVLYPGEKQVSIGPSRPAATMKVSAPWCWFPTPSLARPTALMKSTGSSANSWGERRWIDTVRNPQIPACEPPRYFLARYRHTPRP
ncbi:MAG: nuclease domain-containing protein [Pseudomonadota bacterium]